MQPLIPLVMVSLDDSPPPHSVHQVKKTNAQAQPRNSRFTGWRVGLVSGTSIVVVVLLINISMALWATKRSGIEEGIGTIYEGSCGRTKMMSLWIHLGINILSTLLLGASNYAMQCISAPTRKEVDRAHARRIWLDIGVPSMRNLQWLSSGKVILWLLLCLTSVPLHLL
jgi:hypothetical protein